MTPKVGLLYYNKYHDKKDYPDGPAYYKCEWIGETFSVFSYEAKNTKGEIGRSEFVMSASQIQHWAEYHKPLKYERWAVWWNHSEDDFLKRGAYYAHMENRIQLERFEKQFLIHRVDHLVLEFGTDGKIIEKK